LLNNPVIHKAGAILSCLLLLFMPLQFGILAFLVFFAFVPLLWLSKITNFYKFAVFALAVSVVFVLLTELMFFNSQFKNLSPLNVLIQIFMFAVPWMLYQLIRQRHNQKLGYWMLICSWLTLEWFAGQFWNSWQGLQLGTMLADTDLFVQWYEWGGVSGGSLWVLVLNIQIYRLLFPEKEKSAKVNFLNAALLLLAPLMLSLFITISNNKNQKDGKKIFLIGENVISDSDCRPDENNLKDKKSNFDDYKNLNADILSLGFTNEKEIEAFLKKKSDSVFIKINPKTYTSSDIFGISKKIMTEVELGNMKLNVLNTEQFVQSETFRLNCKNKQNLIIGISPEILKNKDLISGKIAKLRAIENRKNIILLQSNGNLSGYYPSGKVMEVKGSGVETEKTADSFFCSYGDLAGRISLFISAWLILGTIAKSTKN